VLWWPLLAFCCVEAAEVRETTMHDLKPCQRV
jgi:hypothetical protein